MNNLNSEDNKDVREMSDEEIRISFAKCFNTKDGRIVLSFLRKITMERYLGPNSTSDELRHLEGQRHLVGYINSLCRI